MGRYAGQRDDYVPGRMEWDLVGFHHTTLNSVQGASLVAQSSRIHLPMWETAVQPLIQEDPTCQGAIKSGHHNY